MTRKAALYLQKGDKVRVNAAHYTGKMKLTEAPVVSGTGTVFLFGRGAGGCLLGCTHENASLTKHC